MDESILVKTKKIKTIIEAEEELLSSVSTKKVSRKKSTKTTLVESTVADGSVDLPCESEIEKAKISNKENSKKSTNVKKVKSKNKKQKTDETDTQNISVRKSFSKFDELQKKNISNARSKDDGNVNEKFNGLQSANGSNCRLCMKPVYKMEEIKAEMSIFHRNCFRCKDCSKPLKVDNYQSHDGVLYCLNHFKMLFAPKVMNDSTSEKPRKPELIIRENEPEELPPDVVRASSKPDLGLEELQQLDVRSRFKLFENGNAQLEEGEKLEEPRKIPMEKSASIASKLAKLQQHGCFIGEKVLNSIEANYESEENDENSNSDDDIDLERSKKCTQKERPIGIGEAMLDIKSKFESGHAMTKEGRREERKQEIQNIRSRLFLGKQARIKEMYQQAVADSEHGTMQAEKKTGIESSGAAKTLKERFEKGNIFQNHTNEQEENKQQKPGVVDQDADVFESAISKKSRSIFMELDANLAAGKNNTENNFIKKIATVNTKRINSESEQENDSQENYTNIVRYDEKPEDVKIETSEISQKFKFFETFRPPPVEKRKFRITPPRDGVVKLPALDSDEETQESKSIKDNILEKSQTTSKMLNKFREMEQNTFGNHQKCEGPRPLKCFTPPPDDGRRIYQDQDSEFDSDEDETEECSDEDIGEKLYENDEALKEAQLAARAKVLRAKFEKWQTSEKVNEKTNDHMNIYSQDGFDDASIESTKTLRERFENMNKLKEPAKSRCQVNRFV